MAVSPVNNNETKTVKVCLECYFTNKIVRLIAMGLLLGNGLDAGFVKVNNWLNISMHLDHL